MVIFHCNGKLVDGRCYKPFPSSRRLNIPCESVPTSTVTGNLFSRSACLRLRRFMNHSRPGWETSCSGWFTPTGRHRTKNICNLWSTETEKERLFVAEESGV